MTEQQPSEPEQPAQETAEDLGDALGLSETKAVPKRGGRRSGVGCLILLVVIALLGVVAWVGLTKGVDWAKDYFSDPEDFAGAGEGIVLVEVADGDTSADMGRTLKEQGVVASVEAFTGVAYSHPDEAKLIQPGFYEMRKKMSAADAFSILTDPSNQLTTKVTVPEGLRVDDILPLLSEATVQAKKAGDVDRSYKVAAFRKALGDPEVIGLPAYAEGNAEGYLFPATYAFSPNARPADMLRAMVDRWETAADDAGLVDAAKKLGYTPHELMTIASLVQAEGRGDYMPKVARVIYNRLEGPGDKGGTNGLLQIDATINYALDRTGTVNIDAEDRRVSSPYNTYVTPGLVPGPINSPGDEAIEAATHPAEGGWYYYVTVNLQTGETKFAKTYAEHQRNVSEYGEYCRNESASGCS